jgi:hypothetical protein
MEYTYTIRYCRGGTTNYFLSHITHTHSTHILSQFAVGYWNGTHIITRDILTINHHTHTGTPTSSTLYDPRLVLVLLVDVSRLLVPLRAPVCQL